MHLKSKRHFHITGSVLILIMLSSCIGASTSLFGPAVTVAKSGSIYQGAISYTSSKIIKKQFNYSPTEYISTFLEQDSHKSKLTLSLNKINKNTEPSTNSKNSLKAYNTFLKTVKKTLK